MTEHSGHSLFPKAARQLILRADAGSQLGTGHVMRCMALAQSWQHAEGQVTFVMASESPELESRLRDGDMVVAHLSTHPGSLDDARRTIDLARGNNAQWVVVDGYQFGADYQKAIKDAGLRLLIVDDYGHAGRYYADLVLNQNLSASELLYQHREPYTQLLLGPRYVLLRREFWPWRNQQRNAPSMIRRVLVTLGGADPNNVTLMVVEALQQTGMENLEAIIVTGGSNPHAGSLQSAIRGLHPKFRLMHNVTNMPELMAWADIAISGGGTTCWELAFMAVPSLVIVLADNQRPVAAHLEANNWAVNLGWFEDIKADDVASAFVDLASKPDRRAKMAQCSHAMVDGDGTERVLLHLKDERFRLRTLRAGDRQMIWEWANEPDTRAASFSPSPIPWETHVQWFESKLSDPSYAFYVVVNEQDDPIGQVRYEIDGREAIISVSLVAELRGQGYGSAVIEHGSQGLLKHFEVDVIRAYVKTGNKASARAFLRAGFQEAGSCTVDGDSATQFVLRREARL